MIALVGMGAVLMASNPSQPQYDVWVQQKVAGYAESQGSGGILGKFLGYLTGSVVSSGHVTQRTNLVVASIYTTRVSSYTFTTVGIAGRFLLISGPPGISSSATQGTPTATPAPSRAPVASTVLHISSVGRILPAESQDIFIRGTGFGTLTPYRGDSSFLRITDTTANWTAGYETDTITDTVSHWTNTEIVVTGFGGAYGTLGFAGLYRYFLQKGDQIQVSVWNPMTDAGPATALTIVQ